jgi:hypothetical protein
MRIEQKSPQPDPEYSPNESAFALLEAENAGLRRMIVDLLETNQRLRQQLQGLANNRNASANDATPVMRVDPQAA